MKTKATKPKKSPKAKTIKAGPIPAGGPFYLPKPTLPGIYHPKPKVLILVFGKKLIAKIESITPGSPLISMSYKDGIKASLKNEITLQKLIEVINEKGSPFKFNKSFQKILPLATIEVQSFMQQAMSCMQEEKMKAYTATANKTKK